MILNDLQKELLKVRDKTDIYNIADKNRTISSLLDRMNASHIEAIKS
jgi:hypothetical protein